MKQPDVSFCYQRDYVRIGFSFFTNQCFFDTFRHFLTNSRLLGKKSTFLLTKLTFPSMDDPDLWKLTAEQVAKSTDHFSSSNLIGSGGFGTVYKGLLYGTKVAIKKLHVRTMDHKAEEENMWREVSMLARLRHPHIVLLIGACAEQMCIVTEFVSGGSLHDRLTGIKSSSPSLPSSSSSSRRPLLWFDRFRIASEMAAGLLHMHLRKILHRDMKPENVLLDRHNSCKLADVGLAKLYGNNKSTLVSDIRGTFGYIDPHQQETGQLTKQSDIYSLGLTIIQLMTGISDIAEVHELLLVCESRQEKQNSTDALKALLKRMVDSSDYVEEVSKAFRNVMEHSTTSRWQQGMDKATEIVLEKLDKFAGNWPKDKAGIVVRLALQCVEKSRELRPNLEEKVVPVLYFLSQQAEKEHEEQQEEEEEEERERGRERPKNAETREPSFVHSVEDSVKINEESVNLEKNKSEEISPQSPSSPPSRLPPLKKGPKYSSAKSPDTSPKCLKGEMVQELQYSRKWGWLFRLRRSGLSHLWEKHFINLYSHPSRISCFKGLPMIAGNEVPEKEYFLSASSRVVEKGTGIRSGKKLFCLSLHGKSHWPLVLGSESEDDILSWLKYIQQSIASEVKSHGSQMLHNDSSAKRNARPVCVYTIEISLLCPSDTAEIECVVSSLATSKDGLLWAGVGSTITGSRGEELVASSLERKERGSVSCLTVSQDGSLWSGTDTGYISKWCWDERSLQLENVATSFVNEGISVLLSTSDGIVWSGHGASIETWGHVVKKNVCQSLNIFRVHTDKVESLAIGSEDLIWSGSRDGTIKAWRQGRGCIASLDALMGPIVAIAKGLDDILWSAGDNGLIKGWKLSVCQFVIESRSDISPRAMTIGVGGELWSGHVDGTIRAWREGKGVFTLIEHDDEITALYVAKDGTLWSSSADMTIKGWSSSHQLNEK